MIKMASRLFFIKKTVLLSPSCFILLSTNVRFSYLYFSFIPVLFFLSGCQPGHLWIKEADLDQVDQQFKQINLALNEQQQVLAQQILANQQLHQALNQQQQTLNQLNLKLTNVEQNLTAQSADDRLEDQPVIKLREDENATGQYRYIDSKLLIGSVEKVGLIPSEWWFDARIDSGAATSSLDAREITVFERDGKRWVKFFLLDRENDKKLAIELPVKRMVKILQASNEESERRAVVEFQVTLGDIEQLVEFTLSDRAHLEYPILIGRNVLKDLMLVDVSKKFIAQPSQSNFKVDLKTEGEK